MEEGLWGERLTLSFYCSGMDFDPDILCKSPDSGGRNVELSKGQPVGGAVEQQTPKNSTADADVSSEVTDHLDQPRDDPSVPGASLGCLTDVNSYSQVRFRAAAIFSRLEVRWFQGGFLISVLGFNHF